MNKKIKNLGPRENHPYTELIPPNSKTFIIGSFPISKFTNPMKRHEIVQAAEIDFFYGGAKNKLWDLLGQCFNTELKSKIQILTFLEQKKIAIGDIIKSCRRLDDSSLDKDLKEIEWNYDIHAKTKNMELLFTSKIVKEWYEKHIHSLDNIKYRILPSPSAAALISLASKAECKEWLKENPSYRPTHYRLHLYKKIFEGQD